MPSGGSSGGDRAVTVQIGAVILFGFLIVALSTYQATVVPDQNAEVEFLHNQEVQNDLIELSGSIAATGRMGDAAPASIQLGTRYPSRAFLINPPPASGRIRTADPPGGPNVTLANVSVITSVSNEAGDYWSDAANRNKSTRFIVYDPQYNEYREAPTTRIETGVVFNEFSATRNITLTDQSVVQGDRVTLVTVRGNMSRSGISLVSVDPTAISSVSRRERVRGNLTITIPTTLDNTTWNDLLADQIDDGWVNRTEQAGPNRVTIHLNDSRNYSLGIAAVGVGSGSSVTNQAAYLDVEQRPSEMTNGTTREVVLEVRDQFGNPVVGQTVSAATPTNGSFADRTVQTDSDGRATFEYTAGSGDQTLDFSLEDPDAGFDPSTPEDVRVDVVVNQGGAGGGGGTGTDEINPAESGDVRLESESTSGDTVTLTLNNTGSTTNITSARINFYFETSANNKEFDSARLNGIGPDLVIGGPIETLNSPIEISGNMETDVNVNFDGAGTTNNGEFFIITISYDNGETDTYFVNVQGQGRGG